jgi:plastocyanin
MRLFVGSAAVLVLVFATACGGGGSTTPTDNGGGGDNGTFVIPTEPPPTSAAGQAAASCAAAAAASGPVIAIDGTHSLNPSDETISAGTSITWTNNGTSTHQIAFATGPKCAYQIAGKSVSITFNTPGTYSYICSIHPTYMKGTITVQ